MNDKTEAPAVIDGEVLPPHDESDEPRTDLVVAVKPSFIVDAFKTDEGVDQMIAMVKEEIAKHPVDVSTAKAREERISLAAKVTRTKTAVDGRWKDFTDALRAQLAPLDFRRKKFREAMDEIKAETRKPVTEWEEKEAKRREAIMAKIAEIKQPDTTEAATSDAIAYTIEKVKGWVIDETGFEEFVKLANEARDEEVERLTMCHRIAVTREEAEAAKKAAEEEAARARAEAEAERKRLEAERAAFEEEQRKAREEEAARQREAEAKARAEQEAREKAEREKEAAQEAEMQALRDAAAAAEKKAEEAEAARVREAEEAAKREEQARLAAEQPEEEREAPTQPTSTPAEEGPSPAASSAVTHDEPMPHAGEFTVDEKIKELKREIALRKAVYPGQVAKGKMTQEAADKLIAIMTAILHDYMERDDAS